MTQTIVITGSTRGIGFGLAAEFLKRGCNVVVNGRSPGRVDQTVKDLAGRHPPDRVWGQAGDVTNYDQVQQLWDNARSHFGTIDLWINNAGVSPDDLKFWTLPKEEIESTVSINVIGLMYGCRVAITGMLSQGGGFIYNLYGFGSTGSLRDGMAIYGSTKRAVQYFTRALVKELEGTCVKIGALSPGMVATDLVLGHYAGRPQDLERAKWALNVFGERVETVAPWLVERVLANDKSGADIRYLTTGKIMRRLLASKVRKRDLFANEHSEPESGA